MVKTIITAALPYANAPIHIGHLIEYFQADIYARFFRLIGRDILYICASDMHGTPIEIKAREAGISPEEFALKFHQSNKETFKKYLVDFDNYYHTDSKENEEMANYFFEKLKKKKLIYKKEIEVVYCQKCERNLPDRYVKGSCPNCGAYDQYGDVCENCGLTLKGTDLINPKCSICQSPPIKKSSENYFFKLSKFSSELKKWLNKNPWQPEIKNSVKGWLDKGLEDWCISRDGPYYGFKIPGEKDKYFYVWLDAPIGYISSTKDYTDKKKKRWEDYWKKGEVIHLIGKDIIYFHFLFWPAMLMGADFKLPREIVVHGFLTVNGQKMSKSRGTFFTAEDFLKLYSPESLRFYYAQHLSKKLSDIDLDFEDFKETINNKLVANLANFCYRTLSFAEKNYEGKMSKRKPEKKIEEEIKKLTEQIKKSYFDFNFKEAVNGILKISETGNGYFQKAEPWKRPKESWAEVFFCVELVKNLAILIKPILPDFSSGLEQQLGLKNLKWKNLGFGFKGKIRGAKILIKKIEKMPEAAVFPLNLKIGKILEAADHPRADNLYVLQVSFGREKRQAVAGLKKDYSKEALLNQKAVFCVNIKPAKLRGVESQCMILAASDGSQLALLETEKGEAGEEVTLESHQNNKKEISFEEFTKLRLEVKEGKVFYQNKHLKTNKEAVVVKGVKDGAAVR